jgi:inner membrane transporter RhtA
MLTVQTGIALSTPLFGTLGVAGTTSLRMTTAALVLLVWTRPRLRGRSRRALLSAALLGLASAGMTLLFADAVHRLPMGTAATIEFLGPLAVALLFSRRLGHVLWAVLAGAGVVLLTLVGAAHSGSLDPYGLASAFGAAACLAGYILLTQRVGQAFDGFDGLALSLTVAALALAPFGMIEAWHGLARSTDPWLLLASVAGVAMLFPVIPYLLEMVALRRLPERVFSVIASLEPAVSALVGLVVLGQVLGGAQLLGIACVIAASAGATLTGRRSPHV